MTAISPQPVTCPRTGCSSAVTHATESEMRTGSPLWQCESDHHGPRFVGFDGYRT